MVQAKKFMSALMAVLILFTVVPVNAVESNCELTVGGCYLFKYESQLLTCDIVSSACGVKATQISDQTEDIPENTKWIYTKEGNIKSGNLYLCVIDNILIVSSSYEYAVTVSYSENKIKFHMGEKEIFIAYSSEFSAFILSDESNKCEFELSASQPSILVEGVNLSCEERNMYINDSFLLSASVIPENATNKELTWESSNVNVATINDGTVNAIDEGETIITVTTNEGGYKAQCKIIVASRYFDVIFYDIDNSVISTQSVKEGDSAQAPQIPVHDGYYFVEWSPADFSCVMANMDIYSKWNTSVFSISFVLNGGLCDALPTEYTINSEDISLPAPSKIGYNFIGWFDNKECTGTPVVSIPKGSVGDKVFYAAYEAIKYSITYHINGGVIPSGEFNTYTIESPVIYLPIPQKRGYDFAGWFDNSEFNGSSIDKIDTGSMGDKVFYAKWMPQIFSISYETNGGEIKGLYDKTYTIESLDILLPIPEKAGYAFSGWYTTQDFSGDAVSVLKCGSVGNKTFYALWNVIEYQISFELNGGTAESDLPQKYNIESDNILLPSVNKTGYLFLGWYDNSDYSGNKIEVIEKGSYGDKHYYARFEEAQYVITYFLNGGYFENTIPTGYTIESDVIILPLPVRTAYSFGGWFQNEELSGDTVTQIETGSYGNKNFYASWSPIEYSIEYDTKGGTLTDGAVNSYNVESGDIVLPKSLKLAYEFVGWYDNEEFSGLPITEIKSGSYGNIVLYAKYQPIEYSIIYVSNGGILPASAISSYNIETDDFMLPIPTKRGYAFAGWYTQNDFSGTPISGITKGCYGDISIYAAWQIVEYTVEYCVNGGEITEGAVYTYNIESETFKLPKVQKYGYDFLGWYNNADFSGEAVIDIPKGSVGNKVLYANYSATLYTIMFDFCGGNAEVNSVKYTIESDSFDLPVPTRNGYEFCGYYLDNSYSDNAIFTIDKGTTGNFLLYAKWSVIIYSITYEAFEGVMPDGEYAKTYTIESDTITLPKPTMTGHVFVGWYENEQMTGVPISRIDKGTFGDLNLYAKFRKHIYTIKFVDNDGTTLIDTQYVYYGESATAPAEELIPEHYGYYFYCWDSDFSCVSSDMIITAIYELVEYTVVFVDYDYKIIETQKVKHGYSATAPNPPEHEDLMFVFWNTDFSCVISDMTIVAVYRKTTVPPLPTSGQRFLSVDIMEPNEDYIIAVKSSDKLFAMSILTRFEVNGLWAMELDIENRTVTPTDKSANISDCLFHAKQKNENEMYLSSESDGSYLTCESGDLTMCEAEHAFDAFSYFYEEGAWRLFDNTKGVYLYYNEFESYFGTTKNIDLASEIILMKRINIPEYKQAKTPYKGKMYTIVAVRSNGAYALAAGEDGMYGIPVDVVDGKLYFNSNISEKDVAFRAVFGENSKGILYKSAYNSKYLGIDNGKLVLTENSEFYWTYVNHSISDKPILLEVNSKNCIYCNPSGEFEADNYITHTNIMLFERNAEEGITGDANCDGIVNTGDAVVILKYTTGLINFNEDQIAISDTNGDKDINTGDAVSILRYVTEIIDWLGK